MIFFPTEFACKLFWCWEASAHAGGKASQWLIVHFKGGVDKSQLKLRNYPCWTCHILMSNIVMLFGNGIPEDPTGVLDLSLADTSGSSSGVWTGETGSKEGYSNTSVLSLKDMLSCKKTKISTSNMPSKCCHILDFWDYFWSFWWTLVDSGWVADTIFLRWAKTLGISQQKYVDIQHALFLKSIFH